MKWRLWPLIIGVSGAGLLLASRPAGEPSTARPVLHRSPSPVVQARTETTHVTRFIEGIPSSERASQGSAPAKSKTTRAMEIYRAVLGQEQDERLLSRLEATLRKNAAGVEEWEMALWGLSRLRTRPGIETLARYLESIEPLARRIRVVETLGGCEEPSAREALFACACRGPSDLPAVAAYRALARRGKWDSIAREESEQLRVGALWNEFARRQQGSRSKK